MNTDEELAERPFPPPLLVRWLSHHAVNADDLVDELRYWAIRMAGGDGDTLDADR